jgi:signal peptidase I
MTSPSAEKNIEPPVEKPADTVRTLLLAALIAFGIRTFAFEPFSIPSGSMIPTLLVGDYLFVSKYSYGYSARSIVMGLPIFEGRIGFASPQRGDVAVFKTPRDNRTDYIKRVIGLPGDTVQVKDQVLYINGTPVPREAVGPISFEERPERSKSQGIEYIESIPGGPSYTIVEERENGPGDDTPLFTVPPHHYFMMGDNRDNSLDSRFTLGFVPEENLIGRAEMIWFSLGEGTPFWQIWNWPFALRTERLFKMLR